MKNPSYIAAIALGVVFSSSSTATASLIGENLTFRRAYPNEAVDFAPSVSTIVTADNTDGVTLQPPYWNIDPGANQIRIDTGGGSAMLGDATTFDGIVIEGFTTPIVGVTYSETLAGFVYQLSFTANSISLNLQGNFRAGETVIINVQSSSTSGVPDGGSSVALLGLGLLGAGFIRRR